MLYPLGGASTHGCASKFLPMLGSSANTLRIPKCGRLGEMPSAKCSRFIARLSSSTTGFDTPGAAYLSRQLLRMDCGLGQHEYLFLLDGPATAASGPAG